jgi:hypothetical protein
MGLLGLGHICAAIAMTDVGFMRLKRPGIYYLFRIYAISSLCCYRTEYKWRTPGNGKTYSIRVTIFLASGADGL